MFSIREKQFIAQEISKILSGLNHPEMGDKPPRFKIHIDGVESWSWADIVDPITYSKQEHKPINPFNGSRSKLK